MLADVSNENRESDRFDHWLLQKFQKFKPLLNRDFREMTITSRRHTAYHPARLDSRIVELAHSLYNETPPPQAAMIVGTLDMIRTSTQTFGLRMDGGQEVRCVITDSDITGLRPLLTKPAFVSGRAVFRASGTLLRIEAEHVREATEQDHVFAKLPAPVRQKFDLRQVLHEQRHKRGVAAIMGQWPGDETDEQIEQALRELSY